jgi:hypothetical protein
MSDLEEEFASQLTQAGIPFRREVQLCDERKFRIDFLICTPSPTGPTLAVEIQGGGALGRHSRIPGLQADGEKAALCCFHDWFYLPFPTTMIHRGQAISIVTSLYRGYDPPTWLLQMPKKRPRIRRRKKRK